MTGPGFLIALDQYLEWLRECHVELTATERETLFGFVEWCLNLEAIEEHTLGDCHCDDAARLTDAARTQEE